MKQHLRFESIRSRTAGAMLALTFIFTLCTPLPALGDRNNGQLGGSSLDASLQICDLAAIRNEVMGMYYEISEALLCKTVHVYAPGGGDPIDTEFLSGPLCMASVDISFIYRQRPNLPDLRDLYEKVELANAAAENAAGQAAMIEGAGPNVTNIERVIEATLVAVTDLASKLHQSLSIADRIVASGISASYFYLSVYQSIPNIYFPEPHQALKQADEQVDNIHIRLIELQAQILRCADYPKKDENAYGRPGNGPGLGDSQPEPSGATLSDFAEHPAIATVDISVPLSTACEALISSIRSFSTAYATTEQYCRLSTYPVHLVELACVGIAQPEPQVMEAIANFHDLCSAVHCGEDVSFGTGDAIPRDPNALSWVQPITVPSEATSIAGTACDQVLERIAEAVQPVDSAPWFCSIWQDYFEAAADLCAVARGTVPQPILGVLSNCGKIYEEERTVCSLHSVISGSNGQVSLGPDFAGTDILSVGGLGAGAGVTQSRVTFEPITTNH